MMAAWNRYECLVGRFRGTILQIVHPNNLMAGHIQSGVVRAYVDKLLHTPACHSFPIDLRPKS